MMRFLSALVFSMLVLCSNAQSNVLQALEKLENGTLHHVVAGVQTQKNFQLFETRANAGQQPMRIASIAKPITAVAAYTLVEEGLLRLDERICDILPNCGKHWGNIEVKHLLAHSAGIGGYKNNKERENTVHYDSLELALDVFRDRKLDFEPGSAFQYTSYGYTVLGRIMELKTGQPFATIIKERVFVPVGMKNSYVFGAGNHPEPATYHVGKKGEIEAVAATNLSDRLPGGGIYSSVADLLLLGTALMEGQLLGQNSMNALWSNTRLKTEGNAYGHGFYLYGDNPNLGPVVGHTGAQTGCSAFLFLAPQAKKVVVVLSDTSGAMQEVSNLAVSLLNRSF